MENNNIDQIVGYFKLKNNVPLTPKNISKNTGISRKKVGYILKINDNFSNVESIMVGSNKNHCRAYKYI